MNATARRRESSSTATIIPLYPSLITNSTKTAAETVSPAVSGTLLAPSDSLSDRIRAAVEMVIAEDLIKQTLRLVQTDNPFDSVYLSRLTPDPIVANDIARIRTFAAIEDLSASIQFNDGWDD